MRIHSPIGNCIEKLRIIRETALKYQAKLSRSEASTRSSLVDPLLRSLGWDTSNPNFVEFEKTIPPQSRVDYALFDNQNKIQVIIEAKALGGNLSDKGVLLNLVMYALTSGVKNIFLTDGVIWEHYTNYEPGNIGASKTLDFTKDNLLDCASYLIQELDAAKYWPGETAEVPPSEQFSQQMLDLRNEISTLRNILSSIQQAAVKPPIGEETSPIPQAKDGDFIELTRIDTSTIKGKKPPVLLRLPDGSIKQIKTWREILVENCYFVLSCNPNIPIPLPDKAGKTKNLLDTESPGDDIAQYPYEYNGRKIFIYTNYDSKNCVLNALHILQFLDAKNSRVAPAVKFS